VIVTVIVTQVNVLEKFKTYKKILLLGGSGQVGSEILATDLINNFEIKAPDRNLLNLENKNQIINFFDNNNFDLIINLAAYTDVDNAENDRDKVNLLNHELPKILSIEGDKRGINLMHISTDYVFGKKNTGPYAFNSQKGPQNYYGLTKSLGEDEVLKNHSNATIIRLSSVFSRYGNNFVKTMVNLFMERDEINVVKDQKISLTSAKNFSQNILSLIRINSLNEELQLPELKTIHFANNNYTTWYDLALFILKEIKILDPKINCKINPILSKDWLSDAFRPLDSRLLINSKLMKDYNILTEDWEVSVRDIIKKIYKDILGDLSVK